MDESTPIRGLKGVGPARLEQLSRLGVRTVGDLLRLAPRDYRDLAHGKTLREAAHRDTVAVRGRFASSFPRPVRLRSGITLVQARLQLAEGGSVLCVWYNQPWIGRSLTGEEVVAIGSVDLRQGSPRLINPVLETGELMNVPVLPVYPLVRGLNQKQLRGWIRQALDEAELPESLPEDLVRKLKLPSRADAVRNLHFPARLSDAAEATRRRDAEELLLYGALLRRKKALLGRNGNPCPISAGPLPEFLKALPYTPTGAQRRVMDEIAADLSGSCPMNRLVQGDVGCGKTLVAEAALFLAAKAGFQSAMMAPTEVLARQLFSETQKALSPYGIRVGCMTAGAGTAALKQAREACRTGAWDVVVGTHALIQDSVSFARLGLVITDEQHRFGVSQRAALRGKGDSPHMLVMSATPVPRTLGLLLFADLDLSRIDELPRGRKPIRTRVVSDEKRADMYRYLAENARKGEQCYIVCPAIEANEELPMRNVEEVAEELKNGVMADIPLAILHGQLPPEQKERILEDFRENRTRVLVSTTVIEVGINVPNATVMVIEDAGRFGLAQLHQLRGRVGRGEKESYCFLLGDGADEDAMQRLNLLASCTDGFRLAEEDMKLRGPGEFLGTRQAGADLTASIMVDHPQLALDVVKVLDDLFADDAPAEVRDAILAAAEARYEGLRESIVMN